LEHLIKLQPEDIDKLELEVGFAARLKDKINDYNPVRDVYIYGFSSRFVIEVIVKISVLVFTLGFAIGIVTGDNATQSILRRKDVLIYFTYFVFLRALYCNMLGGKRLLKILVFILCLAIGLDLIYVVIDGANDVTDDHAQLVTNNATQSILRDAPKLEL